MPKPGLTGVGAFDAYGALFDVHSATGGTSAGHTSFQVDWFSRFDQPPERLPNEPRAEIPPPEPLPKLVYG